MGTGIGSEGIQEGKGKNKGARWEGKIGGMRFK
jgi:hypothetical protein